MGASEAVQTETVSRMEKSIEALKKDFLHIRTGRATPALLDGIKVDYYGTPMPVNQIASISVPDARMIMVQPWEKQMLGAVEKAIKAANLGLNPQSDGNVLRIPIPSLSEERRKDLFKNCKQIAEDAKVAVRNIRRDSNEKLKKAEKDKEITEDLGKKALEAIQKLTDSYIATVDKHLVAKEKEIMEV